MIPELITHCSVSERDLYFLSVSRPDSFPETVSLPAKNFSVLLALDATAVATTTISTIARNLLRAGAVYFCCYGPDCERVHDIIDEELIVCESDQENDSSVIMTTWHSDETLADATCFFVRNTFPDDKYFDTCKAGLAISCGNSSWNEQIIAQIKELA